MNPPKMGLAELVRRVGDENIVLEPIESNVQGAKALTGMARGLTEIRIVTSQTNPNQIMGLTTGTPLPKIGLVIWFDRDRYDKAKQEHDIDAGQPAEVDQLAAAVERGAKLEMLLASLLLDCLSIGTVYVACRHCHRNAPTGKPITHLSGCVVQQIRDILAAGV